MIDIDTDEFSFPVLDLESPPATSAHVRIDVAALSDKGKVERFFRTVDDECLALQRQWTFTHRNRAVERFVRFYNHERPHLSLSGMTPVQRRDSYFRSLRP